MILFLLSWDIIPGESAKMSVAENDLQKMISSYKEIIKEAEANKHRYLKIKVKARGKAGRRTFLNKEEWASLIFDKIGVAVDEVQGIDN